MMDATKQYDLVEKIANTLRGMTLDPHTSEGMKSALRPIIQKCEEALEELEEDL